MNLVGSPRHRSLPGGRVIAPEGYAYGSDRLPTTGPGWTVMGIHDPGSFQGVKIAEAVLSGKGVNLCLSNVSGYGTAQQ